MSKATNNHQPTGGIIASLENTQPQLIAVSRLEKSPLNSRRTAGTMGMDELKASLLAHGLMQNLVATDAGDGTYRVIAGGRRLEAIHALQAEGKLPRDFAVPCQIVTEEHALEMSLAENTVRLAMHPADQFEAFASLIDQGESAADVAGRFGVEESLVLKRMKLARVAPQLLAEYRSEGMTLECLMAFTVTEDHRRQLKAFESLAEWQKDDPGAIRAALTEKMVEASGKLARFVGLDAYSAAGGVSRSDLFGNETYLEDPALLTKLAEEKLDGIRKELEAEGWGWVEINLDREYDAIYRCSRIQPRLVGVPAELVERRSNLDSELEAIEQSLEVSESDDLLDKQHTIQGQIDQVEQQLAAYVGFDAGPKMLAGCFISIGEDGTPFVDKGLVKPEHKKILGTQLKTDAIEGEPVKAKPKHAMPESLHRDLAADRLQVARLEIARHPAIALDLLVFRAASELLGKRPVSDGPDVEFSQRGAKTGRGGELPIAARSLAEIEKSLPTGWHKLTSESKRFEAFRALPEDVKLRILAYCTALTLQPKIGHAVGEEPTAYDVSLALTDASVAGYWRPNKDNYLSRCTRNQLLAIIREVLGESWAVSSSNDKKSVLVDQLDRAFANPDMKGRTPEQAERLKSWLPAGMSFGVATAAKPAKSKKTKKRAA